MNRRGLCRPSLRITQTGDQAEASRFRVEVWIPSSMNINPSNRSRMA